MIENKIRHADKHVLLDVGVKLAIHLLQNIRRRRILRRLTAQNTAANRHDKRGRDTFAGNIGNRHAETLIVHLNVIEVITADLTGRNIDSADLKSVHCRSFSGQQDALDVARNFEVVIEPFLFVRLRIDNGVVKSKSRLLGNGFEHHKITLRERCAHRATGQCEHAHVLFTVKQRADHH